MIEDWLLIVIIGVIVFSAGIVITVYSGKKHLTTLGHILYPVGLIIVAIGLIMFAAIKL